MRNEVADPLPLNEYRVRDLVPPRVPLVCIRAWSHEGIIIREVAAPDNRREPPPTGPRFPHFPPGATLAPMETPLYRRPRRASPFARGIEAAVLFCILGFSTWLFVQFTEDPAPPLDHFVAPQVPRSPGSDTAASSLDAAPPDALVAPGSLDEIEALAAPSSREPMDRYAPPATASQAPASPSSPRTPADPLRSGGSPGSVPSAPPATTASSTVSSPLNAPDAPRVPLAIRALDSRERAELEETLQRGLVRFGYDPRRPDPEAVAARVAADPAILDLAATLGLKSADVHWLAYDYLSRTPPTSTTSTSPYEPTTLSPRNPAPRPL